MLPIYFSVLMPKELSPCHFEPGSEAEIVRALNNHDVVSIPDELRLPKHWTVDMVIERCANGSFSALIDTGKYYDIFAKQTVAVIIVMLFMILITMTCNRGANNWLQLRGSCSQDNLHMELK